MTKHYTQQQLNECDKEPIHRPGSIQYFGSFYLIDRVNQTVITESATASDSALGKKLQEAWPALGQLVTNYLQHQTDGSESSFAVFDSFKDNAKHYSVQMHHIKQGLVVEVTPETEKWCEPTQIIKHIADIFDQHKNELASVHTPLCEYIANITGYERVMLYKFNPSTGNGEVIGEAKPNEMYSYMGHHFPAGDIPKQARALYIQNPARFINNVNDEPVTLNGLSEIDMSQSALRAVSPIHIQYLKNMNVTASMSISIILDGKLWGLVACHHRQAKYISIHKLQCLQQLSMIISREYKHMFSASYYRDRDRLQFSLRSLFENARSAQKSDSYQNSQQHLLRNLAYLFEASNVLICNEHDCIAAWEFDAHIPNQLKPLLAKQSSFYTDHLIDCCESWQKDQNNTSGALGVRLPNDTQLWFLRKEEAKTIVWGGKPAKDNTSGTISPRRSFEAWETLQKDFAKAWRKSEISVVRNYLTEHANGWFDIDHTISFQEFETSGDCIVIVDPNQDDNPIVFVNQAFTELYGYQSEEVLGKNPRFLNGGKILPETADKFHQSVKQKAPFPIMTIDYKKNGEPVWVMITISPHYDHAGRLDYFISSHFDITQFKKQETNLSAEMTQSILDTQHHMVVVADSDELHYANHSFLDFFGFDSLQELNDNISEFSDMFVSAEGCYENKESGGNWLENIIELPDSERIICMISRVFGTHLFNLGITEFGIDKYIINFTDITSTLKEKQVLKEQAWTDALTGAKNRAYFHDNIHDRIDAITHNGNQAGFAILDIDFFKMVNDTYGHQVGDEVLKDMAHKVLHLIRQQDCFLRWGGEEFLMVFELSDKGNLQRILQNICDSIAEGQYSSAELKITASIGGAYLRPGELEEDAIKRADKALYQSKNNGRNQVTIADD